MVAPPLLYADNAATSWPKPKEVQEKTAALLTGQPLSPGRAAHRCSLEAGRIIFTVREALARFFNCPDSSRVIFTSGITESLNTAILGLYPHILSPGSHVITTPLEHNSVMRPLRHLERTAGIRISTLPLDASTGTVNTAALPSLLRDDTRLIVVNHVSNVTGAVADLERIGRCKGKALFMVDAAQSAGIFPLDVQAMDIDILGFTGHKSLLGPTGTGGFWLAPGIDLHPLKLGGTGSNSEQELQPDFSPDRYEAGTPNTLGIAGLGAGLSYILQRGMATIRKHEQRLTRRFLEGLAGLERVQVFGPVSMQHRGAVISLRIRDMGVSEAAHALDRRHNIMVRSGLHCAPAAHRALGTFPEGTIRFSFGPFSTEEEIDRCLHGLEELCKR